MSVRIISIGRFKHSFLQDGEQEYLKRLRPHLKIELEEFSTKAEAPAKEQLERETDLVIDALKPGEYLVALDQNGKHVTSEQFSKKLQTWMQHSQGLAFVIGGAYGLSDEVLKRAQERISLSAMTFTYQFARLLLVEQLYRSITIQKGIAYHK